MRAIRYVRSIPRFALVRTLGRVWSGVATSPLAPVELADVPPPPLHGDRWARVRPRLSGICGSDLSTIAATGSPYFSPFTSTPFVFGHEVVGEVEEVGPAVERVAVGDRVVLAPPLHCEVRGINEPCAPCREGAIGHCRNVTRGVPGAGIQTGYCAGTGGGWSESVVAHEVQLHRVPEGMTDEAAVLVEPFSCCLHAAETGRPADDETALVIGCGTIGLLTIAALRATGRACRIVAVARYPNQRERARELGADEVVGSGKGRREALAGILGAELHRPELGPPVAVGGADVTFDCVGSGSTLDDGMRFTRAEGRLIVVGMPGLASGVDWTAMWHKELDVKGSYTCDDPTFERAISLAATIESELAPLVGPVFPLEAYRDALSTAFDAGSAGVVKVAFRP